MAMGPIFSADSLILASCVIPRAMFFHPEVMRSASACSSWYFMMRKPLTYRIKSLLVWWSSLLVS